MSHVCSIDLDITDLTAFAAAVQRMGGEYLPNETKWHWYGRWVDDYSKTDAAYKHGIPPKRYGTCDAGVVRFPGCAYDIGIYKHPTKPGVFVPVFDFYKGGFGLVGKVGRDLQQLKAHYGCEVSKKKLRKRGYKVKQQEDKYGRPMLVATR